MKRLEEIAYEKGYRVSKDGQPLNPDGIPLRGTLSGRKNMRYLAVAIKYSDCDGRKLKKNCPVHRIQAFQKFGHAIYGDGVVVRHLDGNQFNNSYENILIGTVSDNIMDMPSEQRREKARLASKCSPLRYQKDAIDAIKKDREDGMTYKELMQKYGISSKGTISYICHHDYY